MKAHWHLLAVLFLCSTLSFSTEPAEVIVDGSALIRDSDYGQARELAIRRAMSRAVESQSTRVSSQTIVRPGMVSESIQLRSTADITNSKILKETISDNELSVTMKVDVSVAGSDSTSCLSNYVKKIVVLDFAFEFSDQVLPVEKSIIKYKTAGEIARAIRKHQQFQVAFEEMRFPYFSTSSAPQPFISKPDDGNPFINIANIHRAQYILTGIYRDFGLKIGIDNKQSRRIEIEAFLHNGANGVLLERSTFISTANGTVILSDSPALGTPLFYQTDFGKIWGKTLEDIATWAEEKISCLPLNSRVVKIDGHQLYINSGSESGLSAGDVLHVQIGKKYDSESFKNFYPETDSGLHFNASLLSAYPDFSILELTENPEIAAKVRAGDLISIR